MSELRPIHEGYDGRTLRAGAHRLERPVAVPAVYSGADWRDCFEVDHPKVMVVRDGVAVYLKPGGIPVWFDHESVTHGIGDIADVCT